MATLIYTHDSAISHDPGPGHPERPDRMRAVLKALSASAFEGLERRCSPLADIEQIARVHRREYVTALLEAVPDEGLVRLDPDTAMSPESGDAALRERLSPPSMRLSRARQIPRSARFARRGITPSPAGAWDSAF